MNRICYIYKITSPSKKIYIGSTFNIYKRVYRYKKLLCKTQTKLYNSINKYGWENHSLEIIEECSDLTRNQQEAHWGKFFNVLGENGLNCHLPKGNSNYICCSKEKAKNHSEFMKGRKHMLGHKHSEETKQKISLKSKGINNGNYGHKHTKEQKLAKSIRQKGLMSREKHCLAKKVIDISSNKKWNCAKDCAEKLKIKYSTLVSQLNGTNKNKSNLLYYEN